MISPSFVSHFNHLVVLFCEVLKSLFDLLKLRAAITVYLLSFEMHSLSFLINQLWTSWSLFMSPVTVYITFPLLSRGPVRKSLIQYTYTHTHTQPHTHTHIQPQTHTFVSTLWWAVTHSLEVCASVTFLTSEAGECCFMSEHLDLWINSQNTR